MSDHSVIDLVGELQKRVDKILEPFVRVLGEDAPVVKIGREIMAEAAATAEHLARRKVTTAEAAELTGYNAETLARHARAIAAGTETDPDWAKMEVERLRDGWLFVVSTIPPKRSAAA